MTKEKKPNPLFLLFGITFMTGVLVIAVLYTKTSVQLAFAFQLKNIITVDSLPSMASYMVIIPAALLSTCGFIFALFFENPKAKLSPYKKITTRCFFSSLFVMFLLAICCHILIKNHLDDYGYSVCYTKRSPHYWGTIYARTPALCPKLN